jgi:hypothetical protein
MGMKLRHALIFLLAFGLGVPHPSHSAEAGPLESVTFCRGLEENKSPKDSTESFDKDETICLSVELKGHPKSGIVSAEFLFRNNPMAGAQVDLATMNKDVPPSTAGNTYAGFKLNHKSPLPIGDCYSARVSLDGTALGTFPFKIEPPKGALPSRIKSITLAKKVDENHKPADETREFGVKDEVFLAGTADLGLSSWLEATWTVAGKVDEGSAQSLTSKENKSDLQFSFSFIPENGWPEGSHEVVLQLDGKEVAHEKFTVRTAAPPVPAGPKIEVAAVRLYTGDGKGGQGKAVETFTSSDLILVAEWKLKQKTAVKGLQIAWFVEEAAGVKEHRLANSDLEGGVNDYVTSTLTIKKGLPAGKYRVELLQGGKRIDAKKFEVK